MVDFAAIVAKQNAAKERKLKREEKAVRLWGSRDKTYPINQPKARKSKPRKPRKVSRKSLVRKADTAFSLHIRAKWPICFVPLCGKPTADCFHFFTRAKRSIRWDDRNAVGSCKGHNIIYEQDQAFIDDVRIWFVTRWGHQAWDTLKFDGNQIAKHSNDDLQTIIDDIGKRPVGAVPM